MAQQSSSPKVPQVPLPTTENVIPQSGTSWSNYWLMIAAMGAIMLLLYLAANGQLTAWLDLFVYSSSTSSGSSATSGSTASSTTPSSSTGTTTTQGQTPTGLAAFNSFLQSVSVGSTTSAATPSSSTTATTPSG